MKKLYWRPQRVSNQVMLLLALVAVVGLVSVEKLKVRERQRFYKEKLQSARIAQQAFQIIRAEKTQRRSIVDIEIDPNQSGLIGQLISPVTTNTGHLPAKQTSINPNFAALVFHLLKRAGVKSGDYVAVGLSGSFPALNIAVYAAMKVLAVKPLIISSVGASQWGANDPYFMWTDMEALLKRKGIFPFQSRIVSLGGIDDQALGLSPQGIAMLVDSIERNHLPRLEVDNFRDSLERRMQLYKEWAGDNEIAAYINIGGGTTSVGTRIGKEMFNPGLNRWPPRGAVVIDSVMMRFANSGVPIIHLSKIDKLAVQYGFPLQPTQKPPIGEGRIFVRENYSPWLVSGVLVLLILMMIAFLRLDLAYRLFPSKTKESAQSSPEPMV